jgi:hypothetical protein
VACEHVGLASFTACVGSRRGLLTAAQYTATQLVATAVHQATVLSYLDDFKVLGLVFLGLLPPLRLVRSAQSRAR